MTRSSSSLLERDYIIAEDRIFLSAALPFNRDPLAVLERRQTSGLIAVNGHAEVTEHGVYLIGDCH